MARVLIAGCGYIGTALGRLLHRAGHEVWGLRRDIAGLPAELHPLAGDLSRPETLSVASPWDYVYYTTGADGFTEAAYTAAYVRGLENLLTALGPEKQRIKRLFFTSSTGVYPQHNGEWVDEDSPVGGENFSARILLNAEAGAHGSGIPATVVRLGGIYGPGRIRLVDQLRNGTAMRTEGPVQLLNLIHRDDAAAALAHLLIPAEPLPCYCVVDGHPVDRNELLDWLAAALDLPAPSPASENTAPAAVRGGNRRVSNKRLLSTGYVPMYPDYQIGYRSILKK